MFWFVGTDVCGILASRPGVKPMPPALEGEVLTTGPLGKFWDLTLWELGEVRERCLREAMGREVSWQPSGLEPWSGGGVFICPLYIFPLLDSGSQAHCPLTFLALTDMLVLTSVALRVARSQNVASDQEQVLLFYTGVSVSFSSVPRGTKARTAAWHSAWQVAGVQLSVPAGFCHPVPAVSFVCNAFSRPPPNIYTYTGARFDHHFPRETFPGPLSDHIRSTAPFFSFIRIVMNLFSSHVCPAGALERGGYFVEGKKVVLE